MEVEVPADGALHDYSTESVIWPADPQTVRFVVPEGGLSPAAVNKGDPDRRQLSIGITSVTLVERNR